MRKLYNTRVSLRMQGNFETITILYQNHYRWTGRVS